jgi:redox-regulated HSP33 family molecular chaperone
MRYLYASKQNVPRRLVATFDSQQQLRAYVRWATLQSLGERAGKFEQGSALAGYNAWEESEQPLTDEDAQQVLHNPSPTML